MEYNLEDLKWKCQDCDASAPPTAYDYLRLLKHQKGHHIRLINTRTGEVLATTIKKARSEGIDIPSNGKPGGKPAGKPGEIPEGKPFPITLPPVAFTLFDAAKAANKVDEDQDLDHWLFECIQKRFELDYRLQLMLMPIGGGSES